MRNHSHCSRNRLAREGGLDRPRPGQNPARSEEQRDESCLQQHAVGLIAGKILRRGHERQKAHQADKQHAARPDIRHQQHGSNDADPADRHQHVVATGQPQQRWSKPEARRAKLAGHRVQIIAGRKNSFRADEAANLEDEREECGEVNQSQGAQKNPARDEPVRSAAFRIKPAADDGTRAPAHG